MSASHVRYSKSKPCPVCCTGTKGCNSPPGGGQFCRGEPKDPAAWKLVKRGDVFNTYRSVEDKSNLRNGKHDPKPVMNGKAKHEDKPRKTPDELARAHVNKNRREIAANLGLPYELFQHPLPLPLRGVGHTDHARKDGSDWVGGLVMPMFDPAETLQEPCGICWRYDRPVMIDGELRNKSTRPGDRLGLFIGREFATRPGPVLIPEGGSDLLSLGSLGFSVVARPSNKCGGDMLAALFRDNSTLEPLLFGDNDENNAGKEGIDAIAPTLATALGKSVHVAYPPAEYKDARKWVQGILEGQAELDAAAVAKVIREHIEANKVEVKPGKAPPPAAESLAPLPLLYFSEITEASDAADFVEDLLIDGAMSVVYGDSGSGKSFYSIDLSLHVAAGILWRGRAVDRRGVLYLALEGSHGIKNRIIAFKRASGCNAVDLPFAIVPVSLNLLDPEADTGRVIETAKTAAATMKIPAGLIVVDTLSRALAGGNENSPEDMTGFIGNLDRIRQALPAHTMVVHHSGKDAARGARGHNSLRAATDTEIEVARSGATNVSVATVKKQRDLEAGGEFAFRLEQVTLGTNRRGKPITSCVVRPADVPVQEAKLGKDERTALAALQELLAADGRTGFTGVPDGVPSVPAEWWRQRFCNARPGDKPNTRRTAFRRGRDGLIDAGRVKVHDERVWIHTQPVTLADFDG